MTNNWQFFWVRWAPSFLVRLFASPYIAGNSREEALRIASSLWEKEHVTTTLDLLGEGVLRAEDTEVEVQEYIALLESLCAHSSFATISLKPTQMGLAIDPNLCHKNIHRVLTKAQDCGIHVTIDMEESAYTDATLQLYQTLRETFENVGLVLQSRLFRTSDDISRYLSSASAHIRLCIGIYPEASEVAWQEKSAIKENFIRLLTQLFDEDHYVCIATHDEVLLQKCIDLIESKHIPSDRYEFQMLLGVPRKNLRDRYVKDGRTFRLYVPYATKWKHAISYSKRRMQENPHMIIHVIRNVWRRLKRPSKN